MWEKPLVFKDLRSKSLNPVTMNEYDLSFFPGKVLYLVKFLREKCNELAQTENSAKGLKRELIIGQLTDLKALLVAREDLNMLLDAEQSVPWLGESRTYNRFRLEDLTGSYLFLVFRFSEVN